jgi:uncharacterized protein YndB with AHSA1/START domain
MRTLGRIAITVGAIVVALTIAAIAFSPFRRRPGAATPRLEETVDVAAPCERVFSYLGDSTHAHQWSVFIDHITPLNPAIAADGAEGAIRRSYRNANEQGTRWDELFTIVEPARRRQLRIFNIVDSASPRDNHLMTEQLYQPLPHGGCRLAFTLFFEQPPGPRDQLPMRLVSYEVARVFRRNIGNVKRLVEQAQTSSATAP